MKKTIILGFLFAAILIFLIGCATVKIAEIKENPDKYKDATINIEGKVENSIKLSDYNIIKLIDNHENSIIVVKYHTNVENGKETVLTGKVKVYNIPLINKEIFYMVGEKASVELEKLKKTKSKEFNKFIKQLMKDIKEIANN